MRTRLSQPCQPVCICTVAMLRRLLALVAAAHAVLETLPPIDLSAEPPSALAAECLYTRAPQVLSTWSTPQTMLTANCPAALLDLPATVASTIPDASSGNLWCVLLPDGVTYLHAHNATTGSDAIGLTGLASPGRLLPRHESPPIAYLESLPSNFYDVRVQSVGLERLAPRLDRNNASLVAARRLDLTNNSVVSVANITFPLSLHTLVLDDNRLTTLERFSAPSLRSLSVSGNPFAAPPPIASLFPNLTEVSLERLNLTVYPIMAVPSTVTRLSLALNQLRDMPATLPASVQRLDLQHNQITRVQLALTPQSRLLCLGGNPITALYATPAQFALLEKLSHPRSVGPASDECSTVTPFVSVMTTSDACTGRFRVKRAWGEVPICVVDSYAAIYVPPPPPIAQATWLAVLSSFGFLLLVVGGSFVCFYKKRGADADQGKLRMLLDLGDGGLLPPIETVVNDVRKDPIYAPFWIPPDELAPTRVLARGGFGVVFAATWHAHEDVAMKRLLSTRLDDAACVADFMDEIRLCARLFHPHIVRFIGFTSTTLANLSIVTEYMERGDLWHFLLENDVPWTSTEKPLKRRHPSALSSSRSTLASDDGSLHDEADATKFSFLCDIVSGLHYLHTLDPPVLHRDVKARNVLLNDAYVAKLTDFGVAREAGDYTMTADVGTVAWIAPEVLKGCFYDAKADVYSLGVLLAEMDTREPPYAHLDGDLSTLRTRIALLVAANELQPTFSHRMPLGLLDLAQRCLTHDPRHRPSIQDVDASLRMLLL
ncbi:TKL protein kinase [Saprolegnia diclina VS20]|uniref:TKL protein kinase n=1 Tax=Saprolegnia diclina (strain VS20) TaxID=1156394 RepID=T0QA17_SAPDV|nr:TKL protein kinase [Saprolegnia diclina VS20]EQC31466.1 TKL protein kinase [Saprolegnia diclina VS20]|eukprot:XP_008615307.1 TKL protein kinase [Saprolegnia diclina VS20]